MDNNDEFLEELQNDKYVNQNELDKQQEIDDKQQDKIDKKQNKLDSKISKAQKLEEKQHIYLICHQQLLEFQDVLGTNYILLPL